MAMQTDVKASQPLSSTGAVKDQNGNALGRVRIKAIYTLNNTSTGSVVLNDGNGGETLITLNTPTAVNSGTTYLLVPAEGILARNAVYATITNVASAIIIYG
jgi:hypothetical protein